MRNEQLPEIEKLTTMHKTTSSQFYSFSKTQRFPNPQKPYCDKLYDKPSMMAKMAKTFGGSRNPHENIDFAKAASLDVKTQKFLAQLRSRSVPGPGSYCHKTTFSSSSPKYSFRPKLTREKVTIGPGPAAYKHISLPPNGKYVSSTYRTTTLAGFATHSGRFWKAETNNPGPAQYNFVEPINLKAKNVVSQFRSGFSWCFSRTRRDLKIGYKDGICIRE